MLYLNPFPPAPHTPSLTKFKFEKSGATPLSAESEAFQKCSADLIRRMQYPELLALELYSDGILSETVMDEMSMVGLSSVQRKMRLLNAVRVQITSNPTKFQNLLLALKKQPPLRDVAEKLKTTYESNLQVDRRETDLKGVSHRKS